MINKEKQLVSQPIAKEMATLGFKQDSLFWWWCSQIGGWKILYDPDTIYKAEGYSAFTIAELEIKIFQIIGCYDFVVRYSSTGGTWKGETYNEMYEVQLIDWSDRIESIMERADTGANARARLIIHLKKQEK